MTDSQKRIGIIALVVIALAAAAYSGFNALAPPQENVVGTLPMAAGGGRDAEKALSSGAPVAAEPGKAADPSGMPAEVLKNGQ